MERLKALISPVHFAQKISNGRYRIPKHLEYLNTRLVDLVCGRLEGLVVAMPPRHGKSETLSKYFPSWFLGCFPNKRVLLGSHESQVASAWGRKTREILEEHGSKYFGIRVRRDSRAAAHWNIDGYEGGMDTAGVGGSFTGRGAHLFIMDDPVKNSQEALSKLHRERAWELWLSTIETRAEPGCGFLLVQTRWHEDDLAGRVIRQIKEAHRKSWEVISFPALAEKGDLLGRKPGDALWPDRYNKKWLTSLKTRLDHDEAKMGPYWWNALYQQCPTPREGGLFKRSWIRYFKMDDEFYHLDSGRMVRKDDCWKFFTVDLAVSQKTTADFFCLAVWCVTPERDLLLLDVLHDRLPGPEQPEVIDQWAKRLSPVCIDVEATAYQLALCQSLERMGLPVRAVRVDKDKVARSQLAATRFSAGCVYLRDRAPWVNEYTDELLTFPNAKHDDYVDVTSMAAQRIAEFSMPEIY